jgi:hypothetical protein
MEYLGAILTTHAGHTHEINRRIGTAKGDFNALCRVWSHSSLTRKRKLRIYCAIIESRLLYSLSSISLTIADQRRLDGFQNRCVRKVIGVKPSFVSRVSNAEVLAKADHCIASQILRLRRLQLLGKIFRHDPCHPLRQACFIGASLRLATDRYARRIGRPTKEWTKDAMADAILIFGSSHLVLQAVQDKMAWNARLRRYFS